LPAKIVVTESKGGSRISLLGASGKELLGSSVFTEPRAKGATLRALRGLLGEVVVEDHTLAARAKPGAVKAPAAEAPRTRRTTTRPATKAAKATSPAKKAAPAASRRRSTKAVAAAPTAPVATAPAESPAPKRTAKKAAPAKARRARATKA
jgi:hypothetical protein